MEKARLITDMMYKMQGKYVDSKLRSIGSREEQLKFNGSEAPDFHSEDLRFGEGLTRARAGSNYDSDKRPRGLAILRSDETGKRAPPAFGGPSSFLASLQ